MPQHSQEPGETKAVLTRVSVPPPWGKAGNCKGLPVKGQVDAEIQPSRRNSPWPGCSHLEGGTLFSLPKDAVDSMSCQDCVCSDGLPFPTSHKGVRLVNIRPGLAHDPGIPAAGGEKHLVHRNGVWQGWRLGGSHAPGGFTARAPCPRQAVFGMPGREYIHPTAALRYQGSSVGAKPVQLQDRIGVEQG